MCYNKHNCNAESIGKLNEVINVVNIEERMQLFYNNPVVNWHEHIWPTPDGKYNMKDYDDLIKSAKMTGQDTLLISLPVHWDRFCSPEKFRWANDLVIDALKLHPDMTRGMCFINPGYTKEAIYEIERCVKEHNFVGIKMYHQYFLNDPVQYPIIEKCIELDIPILMHAGKVCEFPSGQPHCSDGTHFAEVAKRYPEANLIMAHIGGGGDWYWSLKAIAPYKNVVTDMSGSVYDRDIIEQSVAYLGADRILFGSDGSTGMCVGKILGAEISDEEKKTILAGTKYRRFLERGAK